MLEIKPKDPTKIETRLRVRAQEHQLRLRWLAPIIFRLAAMFGAGLYFVLIKPFMDNEPPVVYTKARPTTQTASPGGELHITMSAVKKRSCEAEADRTIIDSKGLHHPVTQYATEGPLDMGFSTFDRVIVIPQLVNLGPAQYELTVKYYCNWTDRVFGALIVKAPIVVFTVVAGTDELTSEQN